VQSNQSLAAILRSSHGTTRIVEADILSGVSGTDHVCGDTAIMIIINVVAIDVGGHCDVDFLQDVGPAALAVEFAPSSDSGLDPDIGSIQVGWKASRAHFVGEGDRVCQTKDGVVIIECALVEVGVVDDFCNVNPVEVAVGDVVLSKDHPDAGCKLIDSALSMMLARAYQQCAMGSSEDVGR